MSDKKYKDGEFHGFEAPTDRERIYYLSRMKRAYNRGVKAAIEACNKTISDYLNNDRNPRVLSYGAMIERVDSLRDLEDKLKALLKEDENK